MFGYFGLPFLDQRIKGCKKPYKKWYKKPISRQKIIAK